MTADPSSEILRLRATVRDLLALSTIPEVWVGQEPPAIAADLADLLIGSLRLNFAFVRLRDPAGCQVVEVTRGDSWKAFPEWLREHLAAFGQISRKEIVANISGVEGSGPGIVIPIGVNSERGLVAAASDRPGFPDQIDQQLLSVAGNHAATAFQNAFLINELRRTQEALRDHEQELRKARDELEIKVAERTVELRQSEREFRQILDFTPQHVTVLSPDGRVLYMNEVGLEYLGVTLEDTQRDDFRSCIFHPADTKGVRDERQNALDTGMPFENELRALGKDGKYRWFLVRYNPLRDAQGRVVRWYVTGIDIEDRKQGEERLIHENVVLREEIDQASMFEEIVGASPALQTVLSRISKVALSDSTVLITGETGTGKELVARAIHRRSNRASRAFVSVNCAAIPRELIASELFGHEKGAFTGATQQRLGRFELANGGTLFLDEVGELPAETQIALLRVLQEHEFERIGGNRPIRVDVRVIAATNRNLQAAISTGSFRRDLFYRLNVFPIEIPALRERKEDIRLLVEYFIDRYARKAGKNITSVDKKSLRLLESYPWPGNIRELQNVIERSVIVSETASFSVDQSWLSQQPPERRAGSQLYLSEQVAAQEKEVIEAALRACQGRVFGPSGAAAKLGIARSTLESKIRSLKIDKNRFRA